MHPHYEYSLERKQTNSTSDLDLGQSKPFYHSMFQLRDTVGTSPQTDLKLTELSSVVPSLVVAKTHHDLSPFPTVLAILRQRRISRTGFWFGTIS
mmetsp:Transcript_21517/g.45506  ORF Transcript_21517/g.45506 Transcript_21517/m.45506 type:complete len:95 (+) Transcript_21517:466-750(+)